MHGQSHLYRSGLRDHSPTEVRARLVSVGWSVLPIVAHDTPRTGAGKAPGPRGWQRHTVFECRTTLADLRRWERRERDWPGTGLACGSIVAIDADFATDPLLARDVRELAINVFGETPFERQGQAPKIALVYRAAESMRTINLKAADGSGDGIDILAEGMQLVAYGIHPKTLDPYRWIGAESPLTADPHAAPEITSSQVDQFLQQLRGLVELNYTGGRNGQRRGGTSSRIVLGPDGRVIDGREFHLTRTVYATGRAMKAEGVEVVVDSLAARAWEAFAASTVLDDRRWTLEAAWAKAAALLDRVRRGFVDLGDVAMEEVEPTYPDRRVSVAEAEAAARAVVSAFFSEHVPAWKAKIAEWKTHSDKGPERGEEAPERPMPVSWAARIETAIGKTDLAIKRAAAAAKDEMSIVYAAPMHKLLAELAARFAAEGVEARVYRGYTSPDPDVPDLTMCLDLQAMQDARDAVRSIPSTVCEHRDHNGQKLYCVYYNRCGMERQRRVKALVWLVPHALLFQARPAAIPAPDALVIDEGVTMGALPNTPAHMTLDAIERAPIDPSVTAPIFTNFANDLDTSRANLLRALRDHRDDGPLQREILLRHGVTAASAGTAYKSEWERLLDPGIVPGMEASARKALAATVGQHNRDAKMLAGIWAELRTFLNGDAEASGRLSLRYDDEYEVRVLERRSLDTVRSSWAAPALLLDATLPEVSVIEPVLGHPVEVRADITARWSSHVKVRQILGAPVTARKLGLVDDEEQADAMPKRAVIDLLRLIRLRASLAWPLIIVVIAPMRLVEILEAAGLPKNVERAHFGAIAGIDRWAQAAGLICIGRLQPGPGIVEPLAGIVTGRVPEAIPPTPRSGGRWYPRVEGGIRLASGRGVRVERTQHPDSVVEALRWQITEAGLIQAIGRLRALRREPDAPAFLDIINDVPLPISVDEAVPWEKAKAGAWAEMAAKGIVLGCVADIMACFPEAAATEKAARVRSDLSSALTCIVNLNIDVRANVRRATYKRLGRFAPASAILLPNAPADVQAWLSERLGPIEQFLVEPLHAPGPSAQPSSADRSPAEPDRDEEATMRNSDRPPAGVSGLIRAVRGFILIEEPLPIDHDTLPLSTCPSAPWGRSWPLDRPFQPRPAPSSFEIRAS